VGDGCLPLDQSRSLAPKSIGVHTAAQALGGNERGLAQLVSAQTKTTSVPETAETLSTCHDPHYGRRLEFDLSQLFKHPLRNPNLDRITGKNSLSACRK